jgi:hypothetical protein
MGTEVETFSILYQRVKVVIFLGPGVSRSASFAALCILVIMDA